MIKLFNIIFILIIFNGCAWIQREYYYESNDTQSDWSNEFSKGGGSIKKGFFPAKDVLTYTHDELQLKVHISYFNVTVVGPVLIPIIPIPGDSTQKLSINVEVIKGKKTVDINPSKWKIKILSPKIHMYYPYSVINRLHEKDEKRNTNTFYQIYYPIEVSEVDEIEIEVGPINYENEILIPSKIKLKKIKGDWYSNGFTV